MSHEWGFVEQCVIAVHHVQAAAAGGGCCFPIPLEVLGILTPTGFHRHVYCNWWHSSYGSQGIKGFSCQTLKLIQRLIFQFVGILYKGFCVQSENSILFSVFTSLGQESYKREWSVKDHFMVSKFA